MIYAAIFIVLLLTIIGFLGWYAYNALKKIQFMVEAVEEMDLGLQSFDNHLKYIYELEMYYGDETLEKLIQHSKDVSEMFIEFRKDYEVFNGEINEDDFLAEEEENDAPKENQTGKNLLLKSS